MYIDHEYGVTETILQIKEFKNSKNISDNVVRDLHLLLSYF